MFLFLIVSFVFEGLKNVCSSDLGHGEKAWEVVIHNLLNRLYDSYFFNCSQRYQWTIKKVRII